MEPDEILRVAHEIAQPHGLRAAFLEGARSVGVGGDARSYTPVIVLRGPFPGWDVLAFVSTEIGNRTPINRTTFQTAQKE